MNTSIESIWRVFSTPLKNFIKRRVENDQDAEDILQNVFYKIHKSISNLKESDKIHAWVYRIARNAIFDFYRRQKSEIDITKLSDVIYNKTIDEITADSEITQCIKPMIEYFPEKYKYAILLTEYQNHTQKVLGETMGLSLS